MKAVVVYLPSVPHTVKASQTAIDSAKKYGLDVELFKGYTPSEADSYIAKEKLKPYLPGPKLFAIKWKRGGVRGCMVSISCVGFSCGKVLSDFIHYSFVLIVGNIISVNF